jgi:hypothetical protein
VRPQASRQEDTQKREEKYQKATVPEKPKNDTSLEDLRAILKKIAVPSEVKVADTRTHVVEQKPEEKKEIVSRTVDTMVIPKETPASSLKAALSALVEQEVVVKREEYSASKTTVQVHEVPESSVKQNEERSETGDTLSPKKLERMMRVTGSDKSPLL